MGSKVLNENHDNMSVIKEYNDEVISDKRKSIINTILLESNYIKTPNIEQLSSQDLKIIMRAYDEVFLDNWISKNFQGEIKFSLSKRMTRSAGKTIFSSYKDILQRECKMLEIRIGVDFLFNYNAVSEDKIVCGIKTYNNLDALLLIFEHELCHVIEFILYGKSNCSRDRFKLIANKLFGHTKSYHELPTLNKIVNQNLGIIVGSDVSFEHQGITMKGIVYRINKRATILVNDPNGMYKDKKGNRYMKYYVPYNRIKR